eukprot:scaffold2642_cov120-Cylindrotheca_fusiformis.AAC.15
MAITKTRRHNSLIPSLPSLKKKLGSGGTPPSGEASVTSHDSGNSQESPTDRIPLRREVEEAECVRLLKVYCRSHDLAFSEATIYRIAAFHDFDLESAQEALQENEDNHYLNLSLGDSLKQQIQTRLAFPLPDLKTKKGNAGVVYMRPSNYIPGFENQSSVAENLSYVLNDMSRTKDQCRNGVCLLINMEGFSKENYSSEYWEQLMQIFQGKLVPTKVNLVLFVNSSSYFNSKLWKITKSMLSGNNGDFSKNVFNIQSNMLSDFLMDDFESLLPDEFSEGWRSTDEIVEDYVDLKAYEDEK